MKVANTSQYKTVKADEIVLPLKMEAERKIPKEDLLTFKLRTQPNDAASPTYTFTVPLIRGHEGTRAAIQSIRNLQQILIGMNITTPNNKKAMSQRIYHGQARAEYDRAYTAKHDAEFKVDQDLVRAARDIAGDTEAQIAAAVALVPRPAASDLCHHAGTHAILMHMCPYKALQRVKRQLRRQMRKPFDMTVMEYFTAVQRINNDEIPFLPPMAVNQSLSNDEILEILHFGLPNSWKAEMVRQGFDYLDSDINSLLEFCQRLEELAEFQPVQQPKGGEKKKDSKSGNSSKKSSGGSKYCMLHGNNDTHTTEQCRTLQSQTKKLKSGGGNNGQSTNKTWTKKADDNKKKYAKELAAFIRKSVKKELNTFSESKRKASDDDEEEEGFLNEEVDLSQFNYEDMDNLKIDSEDEESADAADKMDEN